MIRRALCLVAAAATLGAAAAIGAVSATAATTHVGIVVRFSSTSTVTACVAPGGDGLDVLVRGFPNTDIPTSGPYAGFVVSINDVGQNPPDDTHYWSYWHSTANGWKYSSTGGASYTPKAGAVEGWSYVDGQNDPPKPPTYSYQKLCGSKDPNPAPSSSHSSARPTPHPTRRPAASSTHASAPAHHRSSRSHSSPTPTTPTASGLQPSASNPARSHHSHPSHSPIGHSAAAKHASRSPRPTPAPATGGSTAPPSLSTAPAAPAQSPSLQPTAAQRTASGFPAWGTVLAVAVVAALAGAAWLRLRHRPE